MSITAQAATPAIRAAKLASVRHAWRGLAVLLACGFGVLAALAQQPEARTAFRIKYLADGVVYLEGGRDAGLAEGQRLVVKRTGTTALHSGTGEVSAPRIVAQLEVISVAESSAVCEVRSGSGPLRVGDMASLLKEDLQARAQRHEPSAGRKYPQLIAFSAGDPLDEEAREAVQRKPLPEVNRRRGRVGVEYSAMAGRGGSPLQSRQAGLVLRMDMTRIGGSYWNFSGYWRGRLNSRSGGVQQQTLNDLVNRTYQVGFTYSKPGSPWVAGIGRLYLPWATSLSTLDGGYVGHRFGKSATLGLFAGSTPDPTSWNYNPDRRIAGTFANFEGGSFEALRFTSTTGVALSTIGWQPERKFAFFENGLFYKRYVAVYHSLEADGPRTISVGSQTSQSDAGVTRSYFTFRVQPQSWLSLDLSHNYFRDLPTFDPRLISTGLLDKLLFQGLSGGMRLDLPKKISLYGSLGRSAKTGDARDSWNQMYGITLGEIWGTGIRSDLRYSKFDSAFGRGDYRALSLSRHFGEGLRWEVQTGFQNFVSPLTQQARGRFVNTTLDWFLGKHYFIEGGFTWQRGDQQNYDQWFMVLGRRF